MFLSLHQLQASLGSAMTGPRVCSGLVSALGLESASANSLPSILSLPHTGLVTLNVCVPKAEVTQGQGSERLG